MTLAYIQLAVDGILGILAAGTVANPAGRPHPRPIPHYRIF